MMDKEKAQGLGCLVLIAAVGAFWLVSQFGEPTPKIRSMALPDHFAMIIPDGADAAGIEAAARDRCKDLQVCKVLGWTDEANAARTLPMLEREAAAVVFSYFVNRAGGNEEALWACKQFPQADAARCLSK